MGGPPACALGDVLTTPHREEVSCYEELKKKTFIVMPSVV